MQHPVRFFSDLPHKSTPDTTEGMTNKRPREEEIIVVSDSDEDVVVRAVTTAGEAVLFSPKLSTTALNKFFTPKLATVVQQRINRMQSRGLRIVTVPSAYITDRKSKFAAFAVRHASLDVEDIGDVIAELRRDAEIRAAAHPCIFAARITANGVLTELSDDDGEVDASSRLLQLLRRRQSQNTLIVVTRWFGGVLLGPTRFRHISAVADATLHALGP